MGFAKRILRRIFYMAWARVAWRRVGLVLALAVIWTFWMMPVSLWAQGEESLGVDCRGGRCDVRVGVGSLGGSDGALTWRVAEENLSFLPGGSLELLNEAALQSPWGEIRLLDTELRLVVDADYRLQAARGAAAVEFPTIGDVALFRSLLPIRAAIGYEPGAALSQRAARGLPALADDHSYLYFDLEAGRLRQGVPSLETAAGGLTAGVDIAPGQKAMLVVDPVNGLLFVDGQLMLYSYGQGALLESLLAGEMESFEWSLDALPLRQILILNVQGLANGADAPYFYSGGEFSVDAGVLGDWLQVEGAPLHLGGYLSADAAALALGGQASSSLFPAHLYRAQAEASLLIPWGESDDDGVLMVALGADLPWAGLAGDLEAAISSSLTVEGAASLTTQWGEAPVVYAMGGATSPQLIWRKTQDGWAETVIVVSEGYAEAALQASEYTGRWGAGLAETWGAVGEYAAGPMAQMSEWGWNLWGADADAPGLTQAHDRPELLEEGETGIRVSRAGAE
jgi:hypothetical protein